MENKSSHILIIDDDHALLLGLSAVLRRDGYKITTADHGQKGIQLAREIMPDLLICDLMMPPPNGFSVLSILQEDPKTAHLPFIFLTASANEADKIKGLLSGADDYITKPFSKDELVARITAVLRRKAKSGAYRDENKDVLIAKLQEKIATAVENSNTNWEDFVSGLSNMIALRDDETEVHSKHVTETTENMARLLGISGDALLYMRWGALLHDVGKIGVPDNILLKQGPLTPDERKIMMLHPELGYQILLPLKLPAATLEIPHYHHEKWDGSGYPSGLSGENIPLSARIFTFVDVWDALSSDRPYRKAWTPEKITEYVIAQAGTKFDPQLVDSFLKTVSA